jgi:hypothetical protein
MNQWTIWYASLFFAQEKTAMTRTRKTLFPILLLFWTALAVPLSAEGTYTAASCNWSDVNAVINGPTHTAVNGDTIVVPAGSCTWTSGLSIKAGITLTGSGTPNTGAGTFGAGNPTTIITDNTNNPLIGVTLSYGQTFVISLLDIEPEAGSTSLQSPIQIAGTCTLSGCPLVRIDNIYFGKTTQWGAATNGGSNATWLLRSDNVFGVIDHNTVPPGSDVVFDDNELSAYLGVGGYGDNSWAQPDSFGTANAVYMENNSIYVTRSFSDCEIAPAGGAIGGCRSVGRFNQITSNGGFGVFGLHGLDTDGRPRAGRQLEVYGNSVVCTSGSGCNIIAGYRGGTGYTFGNSLTETGSGFFNSFVAIAVYRTVFKGGTPWGACGGSSPYDTNDGVVYYSGTNSGSSGATTLTDTTKSWSTNQFIPTGAPYSVYDVTQGWWAEIAGNTATTVTIQGSIPEENHIFNNGDSYQILRATVCADQGGRGQGNYVSGPNATPAAALSEVLDPVYEWDDSENPVRLNGNFGTDTRIIANRDYYTDNSNGTPQAQTSPTSPFNGTAGVGWGTLANRPTTCTAGPGGNTPGVGYWATDQGSWNQSGSGGQGVLYVCTAPNTWTLHFTPYIYPHPLTQGTQNAAPLPPTKLLTTVQ